jgi:hypothetical protein
MNVGFSLQINDLRPQVLKVLNWLVGAYFKKSIFRATFCGLFLLEKPTDSSFFKDDIFVFNCEQRHQKLTN